MIPISKDDDGGMERRPFAREMQFWEAQEEEEEEDFGGWEEYEKAQEEDDGKQNQSVEKKLAVCSHAGAEQDGHGGRGSDGEWGIGELKRGGENRGEEVFGLEEKEALVESLDMSSGMFMRQRKGKR